MKTLLEVARDKIKERGIPLNQKLPILPQLMMAIFSPEEPDNLDLNMYDRQEMEMELSAYLNYTDTAVMIMLQLDDPEWAEEVRDKLVEAKTREQLQELLIMDVLFEAMCNTVDNFPNRFLLPGEMSRGGAFL